MNKYIAKYDFEVARKLSGSYYEEIKVDALQKMFHQKALLEILQTVSKVLTGG